MSNSRITHPSSSSITPEQARDARARALRYALDRYFEKQKPPETNGDDYMEGRFRNGQQSRP